MQHQRLAKPGQSKLAGQSTFGRPPAMQSPSARYTLASRTGEQAPEVTQELSARSNTLRDGGQPLPESDRTFFEPRFAHDFSRVRAHTDDRAAETDYALGHQAMQKLFPAGVLQAKLKINQPGDRYEQEADRAAEAVMRMPEPVAVGVSAGSPPVQRKCAACASGQGLCPKCAEEEALQRKPLAASISPLVQRQSEPPEEEEKEETLRAKKMPGGAAEVGPGLSVRINALRSGGQPLAKSEREFFEPRFGYDFSHVRVHTDTRAAETARALNARAFTLGSDIAFGPARYAVDQTEGQRLLAHELAHVVQQGGAGKDREPPRTLSPVRQSHVQRTLGDGHDLTSPRFSRLLDLEAAYDDETVIRQGSSGRSVQAIQQELYDLGYPLPAYGADGDFGSETKAAVEAFQRDNAPLVDDGKVGDKTMAALDTRFSGAPALPAPAVLSAPWTGACVRSVLCPWSPHTIDVLKTRINLKSFDNISWADERWDGAAWVLDPFPGGGYNTGTEIGVLNSSCEDMAETLYHEVLHAEQATTHGTTLEKESYAYRIGEEFSIAMGLGGRPSLRSTDPQGREFADPAKVASSLAPTGPTSYPGVPAGGGGDQIIGKAVTHGHVRVRRPNGSIYTRPAIVDEKVPGPITLINEVTHPTVGWTCP